MSSATEKNRTNFDQAKHLWQEVTRLEQQVSALESKIRETEKQIAKNKTRELAESAAALLPELRDAAASGKFFARIIPGNAAVLQQIASNLKNQLSAPCVLVARDANRCHVLVLSCDPTHAANQLLIKLTAEFSGKGGGRSDYAQGVFETSEPDEKILHKIQTLFGN